jgi:hypothetical protein
VKRRGRRRWRARYVHCGGGRSFCVCFGDGVMLLVAGRVYMGGGARMRQVETMEIQRGCRRARVKKSKVMGFDRCEGSPLSSYCGVFSTSGDEEEGGELLRVLTPTGTPSHSSGAFCLCLLLSTDRPSSKVNFRIKEAACFDFRLHFSH